jgi:hypothetical protein
MKTFQITTLFALIASAMAFTSQLPEGEENLMELCAQRNTM